MPDDRVRETTGEELDAPERPADQLAKSMPDWIHTHDLIFRRRTFPVMSKTYLGMQLLFRADGMVEWIRHPVLGWGLRGQAVSGVSLRSVIYGTGKKYNPEIPALPKAAE